MRWLKSDRWKAGIAIVGMLLLLVLLVWVPVSAAGVDEGASGLATAVTGMVQATPTANSTIATETANEQLRKLQRDNDRSLNAWAWNSGAAILSSLFSTLVIVIGGLFGLWRWRVDRRDAQDKELKDRRDAQEKDLKAQAEERFKTAVTALGDEKEGTQVGGAILLQSFLNKEDKKSYERYYSQIFDLAVAYLRLPRTSPPPEDPDGIPRSPEAPNISLPPTALSQALIVVFKEAFPLARSQNTGSLRFLDPAGLPLQLKTTAILSLDASRIQLDNAQLAWADLKQAWMQEASLRKAILIQANLSEANLYKTDFREANFGEANLSGAYFGEANLSGADLGRADLRRAIFLRADLSGAYFGEANLSGANLRLTHLSGANLEEALALEDTDLRGVKGLTKEQVAICKAKGAIIEDPTTSASQSTVSPSPPSQSNDVQPPSTPPAQGSPPTPEADGSSTTSSQPSGDIQIPSAPSVQESTQTPGVDRSSATPPSQPGSL